MDAEVCYLIYGSNPIYPQQFQFSLLTLFDQAQRDDIALNVILYTDQPSAYHALPIEVRPITPDQWLDWVEPTGYIHRSKNRVVADFLKKSSLPSLFLDTDTYFKGSLSKILNYITTSCAVLHACEGSLAKQFPSLFTAYRDLLPPDATMWNSGLIGMLPQQATFLDEALELMDLLWRCEPCLQAEQLALGQVLKQYVAVHDSIDSVEHYWGYRLPFAIKQIRAFFKTHQGETFEELKVLSRTLRPGPPPIPKELLDEVDALASRYPWTKLHKDGFLLLRMASPSFSPASDDRFFWRQGALIWLKKDLYESKDTNKKLRWQLFAKDKSLKQLIEHSFPEDLTDSERSKWYELEKEIEQYCN